MNSMNNQIVFQFFSRFRDGDVLDVIVMSSILMMLLVASIWPRRDASCTAAPARLEVNVR